VTSDEKTTAERRVASPATRHPPLVTLLLMAGAVLLAGCKKSGDAAVAAAPQTVPGHSRDFTSVKFYDTLALRQQMKSRLSGAEAQPMPGGLLVIKQFKLETFNPDGSPQTVIVAPECFYDMRNGLANSPGHLQMQSGDGKLRIEGDGFLWRQDVSFLTISNHVHSVIETGPGFNTGL
jgi:hypothetical protein